MSDTATSFFPGNLTAKARPESMNAASGCQILVENGAPDNE